MNLPDGEEEEQRGHVAGRIHEFGHPGRAHKVASQHHHQRNGPERPHPGAEEPIVETQPEPEDREKHPGRQPGHGTGFAEFGFEDGVGENGGQQPGDEIAQNPAVDALHRPRSRQRTGKRERNARQAGAEGDHSAAHIAPRRRQAAEGRLQFVGAEHGADGQSGAEEHRQGEHTAASRDRVHQSGHHAGEKQQGIGPERKRHDRCKRAPRTPAERDGVEAISPVSATPRRRTRRRPPFLASGPRRVHAGQSLPSRETWESGGRCWQNRLRARRNRCSGPRSVGD